MSELPVLTVTDFVALVNQTLDLAYGSVIVEGEIVNYRVSKNKYVYFDLKDSESTVNCFMTVYQLRMPLDEGMQVRVYGSARLTQWGKFSLVIRTFEPVGEGSLKKAMQVLQSKLEKEGLFDPARKRILPLFPERIGLITSADSAAAADFIKISGARWSGLYIQMIDVLVQGIDAPDHILAAIDHFNQMAEPPEVIVIIRGGGSSDDLAAFSTEPVVRAVAGSRIPTLVAIGHEIDLSLAEMAADLHASTPSNAAELLVPDKKELLKQLRAVRQQTSRWLEDNVKQKKFQLQQIKQGIMQAVESVLSNHLHDLALKKTLVGALSPANVLERGYAIIRLKNRAIGTVQEMRVGDNAAIEMRDGIASARIHGINNAKV